jgi:hypothetical protein
VKRLAPLQDARPVRAAGLIALPHRFAQKKDAKPVGGRGISGFEDSFFFYLKLFSKWLTTPL